jgi:hypothetical protein
MALQFERLLRGPNAQTTLPASKLYDVTPNAAVKQVPPSEYPQTTTAQSKSFSDMKFGNNVSTNRDTLKCVKILLAECSLLSQPDQLSWIPRREPHTTHLPSHHPSTVLTPPIYPHTTHLLSSHHPSTLTPSIYPHTTYLRLLLTWGSYPLKRKNFFPSYQSRVTPHSSTIPLRYSQYIIYY